MSTYNYSYNVLINRLEAFAAGHFLIKRFTHGQIDLADQLQDEEYPFMHVVPEKITPVDGGMQFDFLIMFADIPRDKEYKAEYQREVISDCVRLGQDLIAEVKNGLQLFGFDVQLTNNPTFEPFMEEQKNTVTGVTFILSLEVPWDWSACDIPAIWAVGGDSTGGTGTGYGITLQTDGVNNVVQNLLNLESGANITIVDNGNGTITINSTGGTQVNSDWNATSGVAEILNKPTLATVATSGDYNDLSNLPTIPAAQVNSDWNAVSGVAEILNKPTIPAAQVNSDWNSVSGVSEILNKPTLATVATTGDYNDLSNLPTIPTATSELTNDSGFITIGDVPPQVNADWNSVTGVSEILNKPTIPAAQINSDWNAVSGVAEILNKPTIPAAQVNADWNAVGGVAEILNKPAIGSGSVTSVAIQLPTPASPAYSVSGSPITTSGTFTVIANGTILQYIDGTGSLRTFPNIPKTLADLIAGTQKGDLLEWDGTKWAILPGMNLDRLTDVTLVGPTNGQVLQYNGTAWVNVTPASGGTVTSVGLTMPAAFSVTGSPVTTAGTLAVSGAGTSTQYVDGTGSLQTMPTGLPPTGTAGGDLTGTYPNPTVHRIHGIDMQSGTPSVGDVWLYEGSPAKWQHQQLPAVHVGNDSAVTGSTVKDALNHLGTTKVETTRSISTSSPLSGGGDLSANRTLSIADAAADGATKGAAAFTAADFNSASGVISLDYTNGQKASAAQPGFLSASDFTLLNRDTFTYRCAVGPGAPADNTTYYIATTTPTLSLSATLYRNTAPYACKLVGAEIQVNNTATNASNEASTLNFRLNNTTDVLLSNAVLFNGVVPISNTYTVTGLNQSLAAGDTFNIKWTTPTWATNPTSAVVVVHLFFERI